MITRLSLATFADPLSLAVGLLLITGFMKPFSAVVTHGHVIISMMSAPWGVAATVHMKLFIFNRFGELLIAFAEVEIPNSILPFLRQYQKCSLIVEHT